MIAAPRHSGKPLSFLMFLYFFLVMFCLYIIIPVKKSLFLGHLGKEKLPYAYLLTAVLIGFVVSINSRLLQKLRRPLYLSLSLGFFIGSSVLFWLLFRQHKPWPWIFLLFWSWADIFMVTAIAQFWIFVNDLFEPREFKRRIGFFVSGGLLGGIAGSLIALRPGHLGTENLILICPFLLALCLLIVLAVRRLALQRLPEEPSRLTERKKEKIGYIQSFLLLKKNRYLLLLSGMMVASMAVSTLVDIQFNSVAEIAYPNTNMRTSFFAFFNTGLLIFSYFFTILFTSRILKNFGIRFALLVAPVFLLLGSLSIFFIPGAGASVVIWAILMRGGDKSFAHSLNQSVRELLYIPIPPDIKYKAKVFIDMFVNKFADGLAAILVIILAPVLKFALQRISWLTIAFIIAWIFLVVRITKEYVSIVKKNLQIKWQDADKLVTEKIDVDMTKLVFDTLQSRERSSVLYAMNLLDLIKKEKLSPELKKLISSKSSEIRARSMDALMDVEGEVLVPELDDSLEPEALDAEVKEIMSLDVYQQLMKEQIDKVTKEKGTGAEVSKMEAAKAMGMMDPKSPLTQNLKKLLRDKSPEVVRYAAESAGRLKKKELVPLLIDHLSRSATQEAARQALIAYGGTIIGTLKDYLNDPEEDIRARRVIPGILARAGSQRAADLLALELKKDNTEVEGEIIEALHKMRADHPQIDFPEKIIFPKIVGLVKKCYLIFIQIHDLGADKKREALALAKDLENNLARSLKYIFELLGLVYPQEDIIKAYQNISAGTKKALDYSVELLDNILKKELKDLLLPLIEDTSFEEKVRISRKMLKTAEKIDFS
jgi:AAA family ATP:ADP antiporter